ncbi:hypothetical protein OHR68_39800 [Spirillospora sp. NBC_00431]
MAARARDGGGFDTLLMLGGNLGVGGRARPSSWAAWPGLARPGARLLAIGHDQQGAAAPVRRAYHERNADCGRLPGQVRMQVRY